MVRIYFAYTQLTLGLGVWREYLIDRNLPSEEQFIRHIHSFDEDHFMIICFTYTQAKEFFRHHCIQMDLAFKMVQGKINLY